MKKCGKFKLLLIIAVLLVGAWHNGVIKVVIDFDALWNCVDYLLFAFIPSSIGGKYISKFR